MNASTMNTTTSTNTMKAVHLTAYGTPEVLQLVNTKKPTPKADEVLVRIHASPVTAADTIMRQGTPFFARLFLGLRKPKNPIPGTGFAGIIETVGSDVREFEVGEKVFGETTFGFSSHATYVCVNEKGVIARMPHNVSFEEAAPVCDGALTSLNFLKEIGQIQAGQHVLINGASGGLGTAAVQLAKHFGAEVTGVCSGRNIELVKSLGADHVIDYTTTDFTQTGVTYDLIFDTVGKRNFSDCKKALKAEGMYLSPDATLPLLGQMMWTSLFGKKKAKFAATGLRSEEDLRVLLLELRDMLQDDLFTTIIDRRYPIEQAIAANQYVETGRKIGNVVLLP